MKKISLDFKYKIILFILFIIVASLSYAHYGDFLTDCGREVYYPLRILQGKVLYKDLMNIYGPFSYMFNAVLYKIFGINLNVLYICGEICAFSIIGLIYTISRKFLSENLSFAISVFTITIGVANFSLFNFVFPYSYGILYGTVAVLFSILFLLKYQENSDKISSLYLSSLFAGLAVANKYDFIPFIIVILYASFNLKKLKYKEHLINFCSFCLIPFLCFNILSWQGATIPDFINSITNIIIMSKTPSLKFCYIVDGVFISKILIIEAVKTLLHSIISLGLLLGGLHFAYKHNSVLRKLSGILLIFGAVLYLSFSITPKIFLYTSLLTIILSILFINKIKTNKKLILLLLSSFMISTKVFLALCTLTYGVYSLSLDLITLIALIYYLIPEKHKELMTKTFVIYLLLISIIETFQMLDFTTGNFQTKNVALKTSKSLFYLDKVGCENIYDLTKYIQKNSTKEDEVAIYPEGTFINFLADRKSYDKYNSLIPIYVETFGEKNILKDFKNDKPKLIILHNKDLSFSYPYRYICIDYAQNLCRYVEQTYKLDRVIGGDFKFIVFKRKI